MLRQAARAGLAGVLLAGVLASPAGAARAAPAGDRLLPPDQHTTEKGRRLALAHAAALRELAASTYYCLPWVEAQKYSIGFFRPKHLSGDDRYLSIRLYIDQDPSPRFASLGVEERAASMFSRYVGPVLRRMTRDSSLRDDPAVDGFTVILEWLKQARPSAGADARPVHEAIAVFVDRATALDYVAGDIDVRALAARGRVLAFDGETALGQLRLSVWDDDFVATYKVKNYRLAAGVTCP